MFLFLKIQKSSLKNVGFRSKMKCKGIFKKSLKRFICERLNDLFCPVPGIVIGEEKVLVMTLIPVLSLNKVVPYYVFKCTNAKYLI